MGSKLLWRTLVLGAWLCIGIGSMQAAEALANTPATMPETTVIQSPALRKADSGVKGGTQAEAVAAKAPEASVKGQANADDQQCVVKPSDTAAEIELLKQQVSELQARLLQAPTPQQKTLQDPGIYIKNLPAGSYRERCFACMTAPDEDGERVLLCTCPSNENSFERMQLVLSLCNKDEEISYCAGMLMCGPCKVGVTLNSLPEKASGNATDTQRLDNFIDKTGGKAK